MAVNLLFFVLTKPATSSASNMPVGFAKIVSSTEGFVCKLSQLLRKSSQCNHVFLVILSNKLIIRGD